MIPYIHIHLFANKHVCIPNHQNDRMFSNNKEYIQTLGSNISGMF